MYSADALIGSASRPLYISSVMSVLSLAFALLLTAYTGFRYLLAGREVPGYATLVVALSFFYDTTK